jgi:hypothetical protein
MVRDTPPYCHAPTYQISLNDLRGTLTLDLKEINKPLGKLKSNIVWMFIDWFPTKLVLLFQKRVFPYYIWIFIIYCSFKKGGQVKPINEHSYNVRFQFAKWFIYFLEVKGQCPTKVIMVRDTPSYGHAPTYQISLVFRTIMTYLGPWDLTWRSNNCFLNSIFLSGP